MVACFYDAIVPFSFFFRSLILNHATEIRVCHTTSINPTAFPRPPPSQPLAEVCYTLPMRWMHSNAEVRSGTKGLYSFFLSENPTWGFATLWLLHVGVSDLDSERVRNCDAYTMMS